jgi:hypothetical protein
LTARAIAVDTPRDYLDNVVGKAPFSPGTALGMIGFLLRFVGLWLTAGALVALVIDATKSIAGSSLTVTPLGLAWANLSQSSLMSTQQFVQQRIETYVGHWLWDPVIQSILLLPTWVVLGAIGLLLTYLGSRKRLRATYG